MLGSQAISAGCEPSRRIFRRRALARRRRILLAMAAGIGLIAWVAVINPDMLPF